MVTSCALPPASIRLATAGATLSLKRNWIAFGASASTAPSAGSVETNEACADAPVARHSTVSSAARPAIRRNIAVLRLRHQLDAGCRRLAAMAVGFAFLGNINPAGDALLAFLHHGKIQRGVRLQAIGEKRRDHELVVLVVRQLAAAPHHLLDALGQLAAVKLVLAGIFAADRLDAPAGLR